MTIIVHKPELEQSDLSCSDRSVRIFRIITVPLFSTKLYKLKHLLRSQDELYCSFREASYKLK